MIRLSTTLFTGLLAGQALASPIVVTDMAPIQSLTTQVMAGVGTPDVLLTLNVDPHHYSMSVRDAAKLDQAEVLIWVGPALTPWLSAPLETLANDAEALILTETSGWEVLTSRSGDHDDNDEHEENADDHEAEDDDHGSRFAIDPHAWLDPQIGAVWALSIAEHLAMADPQNAAKYRANASEFSDRLTALSENIETQIAQQPTKGYILSHDGYQYFEHRFGISAKGHITDSHGAEPGPAHIQELREMVLAGEVACVFTDQETDPAWADLLVEGTNARVIALQTVLPKGTAPADLYITQINSYAAAFLDCFRGES